MICKKNNLLKKILFILFFAGIVLNVGCFPNSSKAKNVYLKTADYFSDQILKYPEDQTILLKAAQFFYDFRDYQKVKDILRNNKDFNAKIILGKTFYYNGETTQALSVFESLGEIKDQECLYLYGRALEEKNLYPQAVKIYEKVKGRFREKAEERMSLIGVRIETGLPQEIKDLVDKNKEFLEQSREGAAILLVDEAIEVTADNKSVSTSHVIEKILDDKGKHLGEIQLGYDSTNERIELEYARTITKDGRIMYAGKSQIRDVSRYLNYPLYSNARAFIISMPSIEVGSIIEYKVKVYSNKLINEKDFTYVYRLQESLPVCAAKFKLIIPENRQLNLRYLNLEYAEKINLSPKIETDQSGKKVYSWQVEKILPLIPEESMPPQVMVNPSILISSFVSWEDIRHWWYELLKDKTKLTPQMKDFLATLTAECSDPWQKAKKIYEFCAKDIRYVAVEYGDSGYEPHSAEEVFRNKYGDCKDQATLLVAFLRAAGFEASVVLIPTRNVYSLDKKFPALMFDHAIAVLFHEGKIIFMDPTSATTSFSDLPLGDQDRDVLVIDEEGYQILKTPFIKDNQVEYSLKVSLDANEDAIIERSIQTKGFYATAQRAYLKYSHPQRIKDDIEKKIVRINPFSKLLSQEALNVEDYAALPTMRYTFSANKLLNPAGNLRILPNFSDINIDISYVGKLNRQFPLDLNGLSTVFSTIELIVPQDFTMRFMPKEKNIETDWFSFNSFYSYRSGVLNGTQKFVTKKRFVTSKDYPEFREKLKEVLFGLRERIILEINEQ
ncbi:MAG: DUF3857 and transglutaminase domain-containing protein [Candidatus Omnitrophica bacterium]|nr:DUF3857 and transglutaminase domain-containing protein [Candidatus Omnitrophota bacterium]